MNLIHFIIIMPVLLVHGGTDEDSPSGPQVKKAEGAQNQGKPGSQQETESQVSSSDSQDPSRMISEGSSSQGNGLLSSDTDHSVESSEQLKAKLEGSQNQGKKVPQEGSDSLVSSSDSQEELGTSDESHGVSSSGHSNGLESSPPGVPGVSTHGSGVPTTTTAVSSSTIQSAPVVTSGLQPTGELSSQPGRDEVETGPTVVLSGVGTSVGQVTRSGPQDPLLKVSGMESTEMEKTFAKLKPEILKVLESKAKLTEEEKELLKGEKELPEDKLGELIAKLINEQIESDGSLSVVGRSQVAGGLPSTGDHTQLVDLKIPDYVKEPIRKQLVQISLTPGFVELIPALKGKKLELDDTKIQQEGLESSDSETESNGHTGTGSLRGLKDTVDRPAAGVSETHVATTPTGGEAGVRTEGGIRGTSVGQVTRAGAQDPLLKVSGMESTEMEKTFAKLKPEILKVLESKAKLTEEEKELLKGEKELPEDKLGELIAKLINEQIESDGSLSVVGRSQVAGGLPSTGDHTQLVDLKIPDYVKEPIRKQLVQISLTPGFVELIPALKGKKLELDDTKIQQEGLESSDSETESNGHTGTGSLRGLKDTVDRPAAGVSETHVATTPTGGEAGVRTEGGIRGTSVGQVTRAGASGNESQIGTGVGRGVQTNNQLGENRIPGVDSQVSSIGRTTTTQRGEAGSQGTRAKSPVQNHHVQKGEVEDIIGRAIRFSLTKDPNYRYPDFDTVTERTKDKVGEYLVGAIERLVEILLQTKYNILLDHGTIVGDIQNSGKSYHENGLKLLNGIMFTNKKETYDLIHGFNGLYYRILMRLNELKKTNDPAEVMKIVGSLNVIPHAVALELERSFPNTGVRTEGSGSQIGTGVGQVTRSGTSVGAGTSGNESQIGTQVKGTGSLVGSTGRSVDASGVGQVTRSGPQGVGQVTRSGTQGVRVVVQTPAKEEADVNKSDNYVATGYKLSLLVTKDILGKIHQAWVWYGKLSNYVYNEDVVGMAKTRLNRVPHPKNLEGSALPKPIEKKTTGASDGKGGVLGVEGAGEEEDTFQFGQVLDEVGMWDLESFVKAQEAGIIREDGTFVGSEEVKEETEEKKKPGILSIIKRKIHEMTASSFETMSILVPVGIMTSFVLY